MPVLPRYQSKAGNQPVDIPNIPIDAGNAVWGAIEKAGNQAFALGEEITKAEAVVQSSKAISDASVKIQDLRNQTLSSELFNSDPDAARVQWEKQIKDLGDETAQGISNPNARQHFKGAFYKTASAHTQSMSDSVSKKRIDIVKGKGLESLTSFSSAIVAAPNDDILHDSVKNGLSTIDGMVAAGAIGSDDRESMRLNFLDHSFKAKILTEADRDPYSAEKMLENSKNMGYLSPGTAQQVGSHLRNMIEAQDAKAEAYQKKQETLLDQKAHSIFQRSDDNISTIIDSGKEGMDIERSLRSIGTEKALILADDYKVKKDLAFKAFGVAERVSGQPFMERFNSINGMFSIAPGEPGAKEKITTRDNALNHVVAQFSKFEKDPVGFVAPTVQQVSDPSDNLEQRTGNSLYLQGQLAKGVSDFTPRIFAKDDATKLSKQWVAMDADSKLQFMNGLSKYGKYQKQAMAELEVGSSAQFSHEMMEKSPLNWVAAKTLIQAASLKEKDIPGDPSTQITIKKDLNKDLQSNDVWQAITGVLKYQPQNTAYASFVNELQTGIVNSALLYGDKEKALKMLSDTYQAVASEDVGYVFFPKMQGVKTRQIESALIDSRNAVGSFLGGDPKNQVIKDLQNHGVWTNAPDGSGFILLHAATGKAVTDSNGNLYRVTMEQIGDKIQGRDKQIQSERWGNFGIPGAKSDSPKIVDGVDISSYATDPNHEANVASIFDTTSKLSTSKEIQSHIQATAPGSPLTADMVIKSAQKHGVSPGIMLAIMQQDSQFGTRGKAIGTFNPGNVGNDDTGALRNMGSWDTGVDEVAKWLAAHKTDSKKRKA